MKGICAGFTRLLMPFMPIESMQEGRILLCISTVNVAKEWLLSVTYDFVFWNYPSHIITYPIICKTAILNLLCYTTLVS